MAEPNAAPTSAQPWMMGANNGPTVTAPMATQPEAPELNDNATAGLSGAAPTVGGPATEGPAQPHVSVARHILDALGGANPNDKMSWAKSILAGSLAGAANVGKVPEGAGFLAGAAKGAQGAQMQKQQVLENQQKQQEMQLKQKADERAEKELQIHMEDTKVQRAMWTAQTAASIQTQQQNAARLPTLEKEDQLRISELQNKIHDSERDQLSVLSAAGVNITDLEHITDSKDLTEAHAKQAGSGDIFPVQNGEKHDAGEDGAGVHLVPGDVWEKPITKPVTITTGYEVDKNGKTTPKTVTAQAGTKVGTLLAIAKGAQADLASKQKNIMDEATIKEKQAQIDKANADTAKTNEETKQLKEWDQGGNRQDPFGNPVGAPGMDKKEFVKRVDTYNKDYSKDLNQLDQARSQLDEIIHHAEKTGKLPGADAVVGIFDAIGISSAPLKGRGFKISNSVLHEHIEGTRNAWSGMALKLSRLTPEGTGQVVSLQQLKDYERIMDESRHDAYLGAGNDAVNRGIGIQSVPRGNGASIDMNTMDIFMTMAKGDPAKAAGIAKQYGWNPPSK